MKNILFIVALLAVPFALTAQITLSPLETVQVKESNVYWKAKLDSALKTTVINSSSIAVMNGSFPMEKNVTKNISFKLKNGDNQGRTVNGIITGIAEWNGEQLYTAELEIGINLSSKWEYRKVNCVLADLSKDEYKIIVGKNWLGDDIEVK
ncbi:MAG: hypothetical protein ACPGD8_04420 [Flavobacteriales bacterium]